MTNHTATDRIESERDRQVWDEKWTPEHDDEHDKGELAIAAACYAHHAATVTYLDNFDVYRSTPAPANWPWEAKWWKPKQPQRDLIRAGALIAAEIDRIERRIIKRGVEIMLDPNWKG